MRQGSAATVLKPSSDPERLDLHPGWRIGSYLQDYLAAKEQVWGTLEPPWEWRRRH